ncbi:HAMP domain-containing histidine kinase [Hyphobacterium sp. CCMP332]|nr:HAMP domain-containing histidine kinase [Hyphobacterium sp. CCMP332]
MKSRHFRFLVIIGIVSILSIALLQFFWFHQAFNVKKKEFELNVFQALSEVAAEIYVYNGNKVQDNFPVEQLSENYFVVMINDQIDLQLLDDLLERKFQSRYINSPYIYTIYDCENDHLLYGSETQNQDSPVEKLVFPKWDKDQYYFGVFFPSVEKTLVGGLKGWILLSLILLLIIIFFSISLYIVFRQKRLSEIKRDFVNNMTHELKTPLSSIKLSSEAVMNKKTIDAETQKYLEIISHEADKLKRQIENVLEQARGEKDGLSLEKEKVDFKLFLVTILDRFNLSSNKKIDFDLNSLASGTHVNLDKLHMEHVIHNLLDNVIKYGPVFPHLEIGIRTIKKQLIITWKDNGQGIPAKFKKRIFSPFFRISQGDLHDKKGYGLGLHYVKNVILAHKGKIRWVSNENSGYFEIILPLE